MKTLYFDCSSGISGNMVLGALTELVGDENYLIHELKKLNVDGYQIEISKSVKNGITGTHVNVLVDGKDEYGHVHHLDHHGHDDHHSHHSHHHHDHGSEGHHHHGHHDHESEGHDHSGHHDHGSGHSHVHRNLYDVNQIIDNSSLDAGTKELAKRIFLRVARAESKVHNRPLSEVHFHEVGAIDSIVDIVGTAILMERIRPDKVISSVVNDGYGFIRCAHGTISVPVPATSEIFADANVRLRQIDIDTELVTPTGAAIIAELADDFIPLPAMTVDKIGWGAGTKELKIPNLLKVYLGSVEEPEERFVVMESNVDDCSGEILGYTMDLLFEQGALDVFYTPVFMKKNRPAYLLSVTCREEDMDCLQKVIFRETTTIGIRYRFEKRTKLDREMVSLVTPYGLVRGKKVISDGDTFVYPEFESMKELSKDSGIPLKELYRLDLSEHRRQGED